MEVQMKFSSNSERAPYSRSKHGSFNVEEYHVDGPLKKKRCRRCCCCTMIACLVLLLVLFLVGLTLYLVLKPKYPSVEMSNIAVANVKVCGCNVGSFRIWILKACGFHVE